MDADPLSMCFSKLGLAEKQKLGISIRQQSPHFCQRWETHFFPSWLLLFHLVQSLEKLSAGVHWCSGPEEHSCGLLLDPYGTFSDNLEVIIVAAIANHDQFLLLVGYQKEVEPACLHTELSHVNYGIQALLPLCHSAALHGTYCELLEELFIFNFQMFIQSLHLLARSELFHTQLILLPPNTCIQSTAREHTELPSVQCLQRVMWMPSLQSFPLAIVELPELSACLCSEKFS